MPNHVHELVDPGQVGIDPERLSLLIDRVRLDVERGPLPSAQLAVARDSRLVCFETFGDATSWTRYILQSVGRVVVASILWKLIGEGLVDVSEPVADIVPSFGTNGKDKVTVEQIASHVAGLPFAPLGYPKMLDREQRQAAFSRWQLSYEPGSRLQWHLTSSAWIIAEITEVRTGLAFPDYLRTRIAEPLGLTLELGVSPADQADSVAPMVLIGNGREDEIDPWGAWYLRDPKVLAAGEPSHSIVGTAADVALHAQGVLNSGLWTPEALQEGITIRVSMAPAGEQVYGGSPEVVNVGLFANVKGEHGAMVPATGSARTFGHMGSPCSLGFTDPDSGLSFAFLTNGYPAAGYDYSPEGQRRVQTIGDLAFDVLAVE
ncbi:MAG TPA: serine hydrolase domain-containing protein [Acidimicrobiales bacterium]|nr:serine hydrolase domain-containing protein [Acidimicrobiales bacterium]